MKEEEVVALVRESLSVESKTTKSLGERFRFPEPIRRVKIDAGMSLEAGHAQRWLMEDPSLLVLGFEPLEICRESIEQVFAKEPLGKSYRDRLWLLPFALGSRNSLSEFYHCEDPGQSSVYFPRNFKVRGKTKVIQVTLALVLDQLSFHDQVGRIDHVKTDCQGADYQIALGASRYLDRIAIWTSETDSFGYAGSINRSRDFLRLFSGFGFTWFNRRSPIRVALGRMLLRSKFHSMYLASVSLVAKINLLSGSSRGLKYSHPVGIHVEDATFVNTRFQGEINRGEITATQQG
jgi:FkbM family methyltransferase